MTHLSRRTLLGAAVGTAATASWPRLPLAAAPSGPLAAEIARQHEENVQRIQAWIREPCIAAESKGYGRRSGSFRPRGAQGASAEARVR